MSIRAAGFTSTELMMVVVISAILMSLAIPGFRTLTLNTKRTVIVNALVSSFSVARGEAARRGGTVTVCGLDAAGNGCAGGADWSYGWMVFPDTNGNGARDAGEPPPIEKVVAEDPAGRRVRVDTYNATSGFVLVQSFNQAGTAATVTVCDRRGAAQARAVTVTGSGRAMASERDLNYAPLACP